MIRVLHLMRSLNAGGIGAFVMNVYRKVDKKNIQFDFALTHGGKGIFGEEIERYGGKIYYLTENGNRGFCDGVVQIIALYKLCKERKYDIIHCHYYFANTWFMLAARLAGVQVRVSHCHNAGEIRSISTVRKAFEFISQKLIFTQGTVFLGCSREAACFLYGKYAVETGKAKVLYNGIDYEVYDKDRYDLNAIRTELNIKAIEKICVFVGRYEEQKNPIFALQVFDEVHKRKKNIKLIMIGYGSLESKVMEYIDDHNLTDSVVLLPSNSDVPKIQSISDVMIAPSKWEGLSIAYIEAQKMSTVVVASKQIPSEVDMGYCEFVELEQRDKWVERIIKILDHPMERKYDNEKYKKFDIDNTVKELMEYYGVKNF